MMSVCPGIFAADPPPCSSCPAPGVRMKESDRTAFIFLPGGLGTMDGERGCGLLLRGLASRNGLPAAR